MSESMSTVMVGWAEADITPDQPVILSGQFHARVSEGVRDPVTATVLAVEGAAGECSAQLFLISCDLVTISNELRDTIRARVQAAEKDIDPQMILISATHTHTAPDVRVTSYGLETPGAEHTAKSKEQIDIEREKSGEKFGTWPDIGFTAMRPDDYLEFAAQRIADAVLRAWRQRQPGGITYGMSPAVIGRNRRLAYKDGQSVMYGTAQKPSFSHVEGYEDHFVYALLTYDQQKQLTGMVVNVPCPSQVSESAYVISADFWHETRQELRRRFGEELYVLGQSAPSGDQSPHVLIGKRAEERMWRLKGLATDENAPRAEIARRIANAISDIVPYVEQEIDWNPTFRHHVEILPLPRRLISEADVAEALQEAEPHKKQYADLLAELEANPEIRQQPRWYVAISRAFRLQARGERVGHRLQLQRETPLMSIEVHAIRIGEVAMVSNPFELYLDYAVQIRELSPAIQTFLVQKAGCNGTYLPTARSVAGKGYGSVPASTDIGPDGGEVLVDWSVNTVKKLFDEPVEDSNQ